MSAFAAYNVLRNIPVDITTFNAGNIDSAPGSTGTHFQDQPLDF